MTGDNKRGRHCSACGDPDHDRRQCPKLPPSRSSRGGTFDPWLDLEWELHEEAREVVSANPDGMTLEQVGNVLGITRERVRQIEAIALEKLRTGLDTAETVNMDGHTIAMSQCEECFEFFPREGRRKYCDEHTHLEKVPRRRPPRALAAVLELPRTSAPRVVRRRTGPPRARGRVVGNLALVEPDEQLDAFESFVEELPTFEIVLD